MVIPINGLAQGRKTFAWRADKAFFSGFESSDILDADILVEAEAEKAGSWIGVDCRIKGTVTVQCDRCLEDLVLPVDTQARFSVKFGPEPEDPESMQEGEREIIFLPEDDTDMDLSQIVYDYTCLSLPMLRVHPEGECNPETVRFLRTEDDDAAQSSPEEGSNPFAALKDMLEAKK